MNRSELGLILGSTECEILGQKFEFRIQDKGEGWNLQCRIMRPDTETGDWGMGASGKYYISPYSTEDEVVRKAFGACLAYVEHEVREGFMWNERRVFGPHISLGALWEAAPHVSYREEQ